MPSMKELNRYVVPQYAVFWRDIALELELDYEKVDDIEASFSRNEKCLLDVLKVWLDSNNDTTWEALELAVINVKRMKSGLNPIDEVDSDGKNVELLFAYPGLLCLLVTGMAT